MGFRSGKFTASHTQFHGHDIRYVRLYEWVLLENNYLFNNIVMCLPPLVCGDLKNKPHINTERTFSLDRIILDRNYLFITQENSGLLECPVISSNSVKRPFSFAPFSKRMDEARGRQCCTVQWALSWKGHKGPHKNIPYSLWIWTNIHVWLIVSGTL